MSDICDRCGLDLGTLGPWKDFVHARKDRPRERVWCLENYSLPPEVEKLIDDLASRLCAQLTKTLQGLI